MSFAIAAAFGRAGAWLYQPIEGPPWFVLWLLAFSAGYAMLVTVAAAKPSFGCLAANTSIACPGLCGILGFSLVAGVVQWLVAIYFEGHRHFFLFNPRFAQTPFYVAAFTAGVVAKRGDWLQGFA